MKNLIKNGIRNFIRKYWFFYYKWKDVSSLVVLILLERHMNEERKWIIPDLKLYAKECGNQVLLARAFSHMARFDRERTFQMVYNSKRRSFYCG